MPMPAESLTPRSTPDDVQKAISATIERLISEGHPKAEAQAMAYAMARRASMMGAASSQGGRMIRSALEPTGGK